MKEPAFRDHFYTSLYIFRMPVILRYKEAPAFLVDYSEKYNRFLVYAAEGRGNIRKQARQLNFSGVDVWPSKNTIRATCRNGIWYIGDHRCFEEPAWFVTRQQAEEIACAIDADVADDNSEVWRIYL